MRLAFVGCLAWLMVAGAAQAASAAPPLEAYGRLPAIDHVKMSPSGERIAYIGLQGDKRKLIVVDLAGKSLLTVDVGSAKVRGVEWAGDDHIITKVTSTVSMQNLPGDMSEVLSVAAFSISKHRGVVIFGGHNGVIQAVFGDEGVAKVGDHWYGYYGAYVLNPSGSVRRYFPSLMKVDLDSGALETVSTGSKQNIGWLVSPTGDLVAHNEYDEDTQTWRVVAGDTPSGETLASGKDPLGAARILGQGRRAGQVLIATDRRGLGTIEEVSTGGGAPTEITDGGEIGGLVFDPKTGLWIGKSEESDDRNTTFLDPTLDATINKAFSLLPVQHARLVSESDDFQHLIAMTNSGNDSGTYWVIDVNAQTAKPVGRAYPDVGPAQTGVVSMVSWTAQDGLALHGVLTLPPGSTGRNLPLVVLPHGGPEARDYPDFDWWGQAFASRGYAVFQPNFRGSSGYGLAFRGRRLRPMGPQDADRHLRRRRRPRRPGRRRSEAGLHRGRQLWRLRRLGGGDGAARALPLRRRLRRGVRPEWNAGFRAGRCHP